MAHDEFPSARIGQLQMIQAVVTRMANASADVKKISMAVVGIGLSAAYSTNKPLVLIPIALLAMVFAGLDAMYLRQERWFRKLYDRCIAEPLDESWRPRLTPDQKLRESVGFFEAARSWSVVWFHGATLAVLLLALALAFCYAAPPTPPTATPPCQVSGVPR
jgi:histidine triad (HIT) family protein